MGPGAMTAYRGALWAVCTLGVLLWLALIAASVPGWLPGWGPWVRALPPAMLPLPGLFIAGPFILGRIEPSSLKPATLPPPLAFLLATTVITLAVLMICGQQTGAIKPVSAALVMVFGALTLLIAAYALEALRDAEGVSMEAHWGGLGGGLGGWRLSTAAVLVLMLAAFSSATLVSAVVDPEKMLQAASDADKDKDKDKTSEKKADDKSKTSTTEDAKAEKVAAT